MDKDTEVLRHSCSHVLAQAVKELWPGTKLAIGPAIADGFYYDFDKKTPFAPGDLKKISARMQEIIAADLPFARQEMSKTQAVKLFKKLKESYKVELLQEIPDKTVTVYKTGKKFVDLCRGPHLESTGKIKAFKLLSIAGAYWRGIETNPMLQRIYGTAFQSKEELNTHLNLLEEAKKRDHRKLGPALGFFDIYPESAGAGLVFYHHKGAILRKIIEDYEKQEHLKRGYNLVIIPHIMRDTLWKQSGHYDYYKENMYTFKTKEEPGKSGRKKRSAEYVVKPMNCPGHS